jgi:hypothetical protein
MDQSVGGPTADPRLTSLITRHMRKGAEVLITRHAGGCRSVEIVA